MNLSGFSTGDFEVVKSEPRVITVQHSRMRGLMRSIVVAIVIGIIYWNVLDRPRSLEQATQGFRDQLQGGPVSWLLLTVPIIGLVAIISYQCRVALMSNRIQIDGQSSTIRYGREKFSFSDVAGVQLRKLVGGPGTTTEYLVSVVLNDAGALRLVSHWDRDRVVGAAADIADLLGTQVEKV